MITSADSERYGELLHQYSIALTSSMSGDLRPSDQIKQAAAISALAMITIGLVAEPVRFQTLGNTRVRELSIKVVEFIESEVERLMAAGGN